MKYFLWTFLKSVNLMLGFVDEEGLQEDPVSLLPHPELLSELRRSRPGEYSVKIFQNFIFERFSLTPVLSGEL